MSSYFTFKIRGDTKANWESFNPVLAERELAIESDTNKIKVGNGTSNWNDLSYLPYLTQGQVLDLINSNNTNSSLAVTGGPGNIVPSLRSLSNPPPNCITAEGSLYNKADYPELYEVVVNQQEPGEDWITLYGGTPDISFGTPDLRNRFLMGSNTNLGTYGGQSNINLTIANLPPHNHGGGIHKHSSVISNRVDHTHNAIPVDYGTSESVATSLYNENYDSPSGEGHSHNIDIQNSGEIIQTQGLGDGFGILPPYIQVNYFITYR